MTIFEFRTTEEYQNAVNKVTNYPSNFKFTLNYSEMPVGIVNALKIVMDDCIQKQLVQSVAIHLALSGEPIAETFIRI